MIRPSGLLFFVPALLLSILTPLFLPSSSVSLYYFIHAVPIRECLGKHSCMSFPCPYSHTEWYLHFSRGEIVCLGRSFVNQIKLNFSCRTPTPEDAGLRMASSSASDSRMRLKTLQETSRNVEIQIIIFVCQQQTLSSTSKSDPPRAVDNYRCPLDILT